MSGGFIVLVEIVLYGGCGVGVTPPYNIQMFLIEYTGFGANSNAHALWDCVTSAIFGRFGWKGMHR